MELWLPWFYITVAGALFVGSILLFWRKRKEEKYSWIVVRLVGLVTSPLLLLTTIFLLLSVGCERHSQLIGSPDGKHVATVLVTLGSAMDQDYSTVIVRRSWNPIWKDGYFGLGFFPATGSVPTVEPRVKWLDNTHLFINHPESDGYPLNCATKVGKIVITCKPHR